MKLLSVDEARARMLAEVGALPAEAVAIQHSIGRVLAEDVTAVRDQPPFAASAMDGWAVRSADTPGDLRIVGESAAGHGYDGVVQPGEAVRIFTGAALPAGCDAMVIQEDARREGETVTVPAVEAGRHIRPEGATSALGRRCCPGAHGSTRGVSRWPPRRGAQSCRSPAGPGSPSFPPVRRSSRRRPCPGRSRSTTPGRAPWRR